MQLALRLLVGLVGIFNALIGLGFLFLPGKMTIEFALSPVGTQGMATLRADFPAFFLTGALFALIGALRAQRGPLLVPISLLGFALLGRIVSMLLDGVGPATFQPMIVEACMIGLLALGYRYFRNAHD